MNDVDNYYLGKDCKWWDDRNPAEFYYNLVEEMIGNRWTEMITKINQAGKPIEYPNYIRSTVTNLLQLNKEENKYTI